MNAPSMIWWPFVRVSLPSPLRAGELVERLRRITRPECTTFQFLRPRATATLIGEVSAQGLSFRRAINNRNSFVPYVVGRVVDEPGGSRLEATLRLHTIVIVFVHAWLAFTTPLAVIALRQWFTEGASEFTTIPLILWGAMYPMCMLGFVPEARKMLRILRSVTRGEAVSGG